MFEEARQRIVTSGKPSHDLPIRFFDFCKYLRRCPSIADVDLRHTPSGAIVVRCIAHDGVAPEDVAERLTDLWLRKLRYPYLDAHQVSRSPGEIRLDFVTEVDEQGRYLTGLIIVHWTPLSDMGNDHVVEGVPEGMRSCHYCGHPVTLGSVDEFDCPWCGVP